MEAEVDTTQKDVFVGVLYFGRPNQPSLGTMTILHWYVIFMLHITNKMHITNTMPDLKMLFRRSQRKIETPFSFP